MSSNINATADLYNVSERVAGDIEGNETAPLLTNGSAPTRTGGASFASSVFNLMNAIMGSGILGLAYAMANTGILGFCILLVLVSSLAVYSIHLLLKLCDQTGINSYEDLGGRALQKPGKLLVGISIIIQNMGGAFQISNSSDSECTPKLFVISSKSGYTIPTMAFSFLCHTAILPIYCELDRPTKSRMQNITNVSISLSFLVYLVSALFGYLTFYAHVDSELLLDYDVYMPRDIMVMVVRLAVLLSVLLTVPLIHFPARKAAILLLFGERPFSWLIHIFATLIILGVALTLAIFVPDIRNVFGVVGSTTSTCLLFVFPGIFYLKLSTEPLRSFDSIGAISLVVFGFIVGIISFSIIVITWAQNS